MLTSAFELLQKLALREQALKVLLSKYGSQMEGSISKYSTQSIYGNQNSASIPGTINGFLSKEYSSKSLNSLVAGFGIGLSWGAAIIETDKIYAPKPYQCGD